MKYLLLCQLSVLFKGPGWTPGMPRLGNPADLPEVLSHVAGSRVNIVCKLQWQDNEREGEVGTLGIKVTPIFALCIISLHAYVVPAMQGKQI